MLLFAGLVKMLYGEDVVEHKSEQPWITQWTYGVLMGFAEDGPVWSAVGSLVQDFNPPALLSLQRMARITKSVIAGNKTITSYNLQNNETNKLGDLLITSNNINIVTGRITLLSKDDK